MAAVRELLRDAVRGEARARNPEHPENKEPNDLEGDHARERARAEAVQHQPVVAYEQMTGAQWVKDVHDRQRHQRQRPTRDGEGGEGVVEPIPVRREVEEVRGDAERDNPGDDSASQ